jgi:ABC-type amino acid transport substrate-binding protein
MEGPMTKRLLMPFAVLLLILAACQPAASGDSASAGASEGGGNIAELPTVEVDVTGDNVTMIQEAGTLRCGVKFDVLGFGFRNPESGDIEGLDADLCRAVAASMDVEPEFVEAISANRIPYLQEDRVDLVISTMTRNAEREEQIDFSNVYYVAGQSILVMDDSDIETVDDLPGHPVCSGAGSTSADNLREAGVEEVLEYETYTEAAQNLVNGVCDAVSTDNTILFGLAEQFEGTKLVGGEFTEEPLAIGIKKDREDLVEYVDAVLVGLKDNDGFTTLYDKWVTPYTGETPEVPF